MLYTSNVRRSCLPSLVSLETWFWWSERFEALNYESSKNCIRIVPLSPQHFFWLINDQTLLPMSVLDDFDGMRWNEVNNPCCYCMCESFLASRSWHKTERTDGWTKRSERKEEEKEENNITMTRWASSKFSWRLSRWWVVGHWKSSSSRWMR